MKDFWSAGGAAAWVQALCAIAAVLLGIYAYSAWKEQELAKRRADLAVDIMKNVFEITNCVHNARLGFAIEEADIVDFSNSEIARLAKEGPERLAICVPHFATYNVNTALASRLLPHEVIQRMAEITKIIADYQVGLAALRTGYSPIAVKRYSGDKNWRTVMQQSIDRAGMAYYKPSSDLVAPRDGDPEFDPRMQAARLNLENELMHFVSFY